MIGSIVGLAGGWFVLVSSTAARQEPDSAALAVRRAAEAMGGVERLKTLSTVRRVVTQGDGDPTQGERPARPGELDPPIYLRNTTKQDLDYGRGRAWTQVEAKIYGNQPYAFVRIERPDSITGANLTLRTGFGVANGPGRPPLGQFSPEAVIRRALLAPDSVRWLGTRQENGRTVDVVTQHDPGEPAPHRLLFDRATGRLAATETDGFDAVAGDVVSRLEYLDYRSTGSLTLPYRVVQRRNGVRFQDVVVESISLGDPLPDSLFVTPTGYPPGNQPQGLTFSSVGKDLYLARASYNSLFLVADDHVVVLEAPVSSRRSEQVIAEIRRVAPGKPIRYVVSTHFHSDHIGGLRPFIALGATIVTTAQVQEVVTGQMLRAPRTRGEADSLSKAPREARFEIVNDRRALGDATHPIEVIDVSPNPHAGRILVVWFPAERLLFEGDMLDLLVAEGQASMPGDDTRALAAAIAARKLAVERIIPVHGRPGTRADLDRTLARTEWR